MIRLTQEIVEDIVRRIVAAVNPDKIIMFGSRARGETCENSDLDLIVVVSGDIHRRKTAQNIYMNLIGVGFPVDVIVVKTEDVDNLDNAPCVVLSAAIKEGKVLYAA